MNKAFIQIFTLIVILVGMVLFKVSGYLPFEGSQNFSTQIQEQDLEISTIFETETKETSLNRDNPTARFPRWLELLENIVVAFLSAGIASVIFNHYFENRRRKEIKKEEAVEAVSELLTEWVRSNYIKDRDDNEVRWRLQSMYWKTILRLDKKILDVLISRLANEENALPTNEIIVELRKVLLGLKRQDLKASDLNNWHPKKIDSDPHT